MSTKNSPPHFTKGIGIYSPWKLVNLKVRQALTRQATQTRKERK